MLRIVEALALDLHGLGIGRRVAKTPWRGAEMAARHAQRDQVPEAVEITRTPRAPELRSDVGVDVDVNRRGRPRHRLVAIGDSLTHGFRSGATFNTDLSYPALIARELGWYD